MYHEILKDLKYAIIDYAHHLSIYDYFAYSWVAILFLFLIILSFIFISKRTNFAILLFFTATLILILSPIVIKLYLNQTIKRVELIDKDIKHLQFAKMLVITGKIKSDSKVEFQKCRIFAFITKKSSNKYKKILYKLKPLRYKSIVIKQQLKKGQSLRFKISFKNFNKKDYETNLYIECY